ncbi:MAG: YfjP family GTPase [Nocardioidaceae bacterium]
MSAVSELLRRPGGAESEVADRLVGLEQAVNAARGRLDPALVDQAQSVVERAGARLRLSGDHTVVALAGATGSGKSSLFNSLCGLDLAAVGVKRPTTSWALACSWGPDGAGELLDWLGIPKRHQVNRMSSLDHSVVEQEMEGLVLLDLPDHDSTEVSHHLEVQRLVGLADVLVWILDPQKYADAAIHDRYLSPLSSQADVMLVVLNHTDTLPAGAVEPTVTDLKRLLEADGLAEVPVLATSAATGAGLDALRKSLVKAVAKKRAARDRLTADITSVAGRMAGETGAATAVNVRLGRRDELIEACAEAAGVPVLVDAIRSASLLRARRATGWPVTNWISRRRADPLKRLHLDQGSAATAEAFSVARSSIPEPTPVLRARVDTAVRSLADQVTEGMTKPWTSAVRRASVSRLPQVNDALDRAVASTDLGIHRDPFWWRGIRVLQWLLLLAAVAGAVWLAAVAVASFLQLPRLGRPEWHGIAVPVLMLVGGVVVGIVVALLCRLGSPFSARRRARRADGRLRSAIVSVTDDVVVRPIQDELDAYVACRDGVKTALRR